MERCVVAVDQDRLRPERMIRGFLKLAYLQRKQGVLTGLDLLSTWARPWPFPPDARWDGRKQGSDDGGTAAGPLGRVAARWRQATYRVAARPAQCALSSSSAGRTRAEMEATDGLRGRWKVRSEDDGRRATN